jgi:hypothetical protein
MNYKVAAQCQFAGCQKVKKNEASNWTCGTYSCNGEENIINLDVPHNIPPGEDAGRDEAGHQHQESVGGDGDVSSMVVGGDSEEWRQRPRHGGGGSRKFWRRSGLIVGGGGGMKERRGGEGREGSEIMVLYVRTVGVGEKSL